MVTRLSAGTQVTPAGLSSRDAGGVPGTPPLLPEPAGQAETDAEGISGGGVSACPPGACAYQVYGAASHYAHGDYHAAERVLADLNVAWWDHTSTCRVCAAAELWDGRQCEPERELSRTLAWLEIRLGLHAPAGSFEHGVEI